MYRVLKKRVYIQNHIKLVFSPVYFFSEINFAENSNLEHFLAISLANRCENGHENDCNVITMALHVNREAERISVTQNLD